MQLVGKQLGAGAFSEVRCANLPVAALCEAAAGCMG
jgi:hypothetical protein